MPPTRMLLCRALRERRPPRALHVRCACAQHCICTVHSGWWSQGCSWWDQGPSWLLLWLPWLQLLLVLLCGNSSRIQIYASCVEGPTVTCVRQVPLPQAYKAPAAAVIQLLGKMRLCAK
jgi:hypothetical protein